MVESYPFEHFMFQHFWSLCIEEQFYLCWPLALLVVLQRSGRSGTIRLAITLILAAPIYRVAMYPLVHDHLARTFFYYLLPGQMDALMFGCLAALAEGLTAFEGAYLFVSKFAWLAPIWFFGISAALTIVFGTRYRLSIGETLDGVAVLTMMLWAIRNTTSFIGRVLNWRPVVHIGVISYSVYIWQTYFLHNENLTIFGRFPWNLICILGAAELSWQTVERFSRFVRDWGEHRWAGWADSRRISDGESMGQPPAASRSVELGDTEAV
jgi:peptidoglycan/LPS O-acetylase OafA/YrhL